MRAAKNIDDLFAEVKGYGAVITNDAPLATALNAKIDRPQIGGFAYTPRQIAAMEEYRVLGRGTLDELRLVAEVARDTGYSFKFVHSEIQNIRDIRKYTANVDKYLYTRQSHNVYRAFQEYPTLEKVMGSFDPAQSEFYQRLGKVAVIGIELFDDLDKHFVPADYVDIGIFKEDPARYDIDTIYAVGNDRQIADSVVDLIDADKATDTAIVMDSEGAIADAVRAALYRKKLPFKNSLTVKDLAQIRDFLQFLTLAVGFDTVRVRDVRELFSAYGAQEYRGLRVNQDGYLLSKVVLDDDADPTTLALIAAMRSIRDLTFDQAADAATQRNPQQRPQVKLLLEDMEVRDQKVTPELVNTLVYAVNNVTDLRQNEQIPEEEKHGVLLADCHRSMYVDRPFVIYLGLGQEWDDKAAKGKDYIDMEEQEEKDAVKLAVLLQQGTSRVYAVKPVTGGKETAPCAVFAKIYEDAEDAKAITSFAAICRQLVAGSWHADQPYQAPERRNVAIDADLDLDWKFSKSSYNNFINCPRSFLFSLVLPTPDSEGSAFGNCVHEFAEFYLCYPELVKQKGLDFYLAQLSEMYSGLSSSCLKDLDLSHFRVGIDNLMRFIDANRPAHVPLDLECDKRKHANRFMELEHCRYYSSLAEREQASSLHPLHGDFDFVSDTTIADYKTGGPKSVGDIRDALDLKKKKYHELQPIIYLYLLQEYLDHEGRKDDICQFKLLYVGDNMIRSVEDPGFTIDQNVRTIELRKESGLELIAAPGSPLDKDIESTQYLAPLRGRVSAFVQVLIGLTQQKHREITEDDAQEIASRLNMAGSADNLKAIKGSIKKMSKLMDSIIVDKQNNLIQVPRETLEAFLQKVDVDLTIASAMKKQSFYNTDVVPLITCTDCAYYNVCTADVGSYSRESLGDDDDE